MKLQQVSDNCFAVLNEKNRVCDANSGLINLGGGVVIDTQSDLPHARRMIELFGKVWPGMPKRVINTHEDGDHVWGNQLFEGAEIIAHRTVRELMPHVADPKETQQLTQGRRSLPLAHAAQGPAPGRAGHRRATAAGLRLRRHQAGAADDRVRRAARAGSRRHRGPPDLRRAVPPDRRHDRPRAQGKGRVRRRRDLPRVHAHGLERHLREVAARSSISSSRSTRTSSSPDTGRCAASRARWR